MSTGKRRIFDPAFKLSIVQRLMAGERASALSRELHIRASMLSQWCAYFRRSGPEGIRRAGRPRKIATGIDWDAVVEAARARDLAAARKRITELECKVGQQQVELDFFRKALRQVRVVHRPNGGLGVPASTLSSRR